MSTFGHGDVFLTVRQLALSIARIGGLRSEGKVLEALDLVRTTRDGIFGPMKHTLDQIDTQAAARMLGSSDRINAAAELLQQEGDIFEVRDETGKALACRRRALEFYLEGVLLGSAPAEATRAAIAALRRVADEWRLPARYRTALAEL